MRTLIDVSLAIGLLLGLGAAAFSVRRVTQEPSEHAARAALVAKHPELVGLPVWFDEREVSEDGFRIDLSKRQWWLYTNWAGGLHAMRQGQFEWSLRGGWQSSQELVFVSTGCRR